MFIRSFVTVLFGIVCDSDDSEYNLKLAFDINTDRHTQWFYFRVSNIRKGRSYKLNMQNLMKTEAVYNLGMQPLAYSEVQGPETHLHGGFSQRSIPRRLTEDILRMTRVVLQIELISAHKTCVLC